MMQGENQMKANSYLYGDSVEVPPIPKEVVEARLKALSEHLTKLLDVHWSLRDSVRCNDIMKAQSFWQNINKKET